MKNKIYKIGYFFIIVLIITVVSFVSSCKKDVVNSAYVAKAVVQAYLVPGQVMCVYLKQEILIGSTDTTTHTIDGLDVKVTCLGITDHLKSIGKGLYVDSTNKVVAGQTYNLDFTYNGKEITASTIIPAKPAAVTISGTTLSIPANTFDVSSVTPLTLSWSNPNNGYYMVLTQLTNSADTLSPIDTSMHFHRHSFFRDQPMQTSSSQINPRDFSYYGNYYVILYNLNADYAELYNQTGNNSQNLTKPITNINNGLGIFSGMNTDTIAVLVNQ